METVWEINGLTLPFDVTEADFFDRFDKALEILRAIPPVKAEDMKNSDFIREYCRIFRTFYDGIFGDGTGESIFNGIPDSIIKYNRVYKSLLACKEAQEREFAEFFGKYAPKDGGQ